MKTAIFFHIIATLLPMASSAEPLPAKMSETESRTVRVDLSQLHFADKQILAHIADAWVPVSTLYADADGYLAVIRTRWICPLCFYNNPEHATTCQRYYIDTKMYCGYPRP